MSRFEIIDCEQRSELWYAARAGLATASRASAVLAKIKTGEASTRRDYRLQLVTERMTGTTQEDDYSNRFIERGCEKEPAARGEYEARTGILVQQCGFLRMTECKAGCSLDGYVGNFEGVTSIKCPKSTTHVKYLKERRLPPEYVPQATHEMWVTGAAWYDFVSYDDRVPDGLELFRVRVERCEFQIDDYEREVVKFLAEVDAEVQTLTKLKASPLLGWPYGTAA